MELGFIKKKSIRQKKALRLADHEGNNQSVALNVSKKAKHLRDKALIALRIYKPIKLFLCN